MGAEDSDTADAADGILKPVTVYDGHMSSPAGEENGDTDVRAVFSSAGPGEPLSTGEVADAVGRDPTVVADQLAALAKAGVLDSKSIDGGKRLWWERSTNDRGPFEATGSLARRVVEVIGEPVFEIDADGTLVAVNDAFTALLGSDREEVQGRPLSSIGPGNVTTQLDARLRATEDETTTTDLSLEFELERVDGTTVPVTTAFGVWTDDAGALLGAVGIVRDDRDRNAREETLARQQERLAILNDLHDIVSDVTAAALEGSTRDEIEDAVCTKLVQSDAYAGACIAEVDPTGSELQPRIERGFDGYADEVTISTDPESPLGQGPAARAVRTREVQTCPNVQADPTFEPWREVAARHGFSGCVAIPICHESTLYGLLCLYTDRDDAFDEDERAVIGQLGETVGHAISAAERKRAMMSDDIIEIGLQCRDFFETLGLSHSPSGTAEFHQTVPVGDDSYVLYGTASDGGLAAVEALVDADETPQYESYEVISTDGDEASFEITLANAPIPSVVAANGGYVDDVQLVDGDLFTRVHLPPGADVSRLIAGLRDNYPGIEPVTRRQKTKRRLTEDDVSSVLESALTERQLAALKAGYYAGFFEWPRDSSGEDVAETLDISPATFHQHVRTAERKILDEFLDGR
ncbi:PAS domain S-box [Halovivax asiaticus JCM 14624]|uniref:PAS domain S-box n=2 Tax=Halovivax asiaticus TaxID=332953 RepID=M0BF55_9EURY|nr:PAS domain S-box [Halovivax asiaticus JCM 14624]